MVCRAHRCGALATLVLTAGPALAGTDTTFDTAFTKFSGFLEGSGGKIITLLSLAGGIVSTWPPGSFRAVANRDPGRRRGRRRHRNSDRHIRYYGCDLKQCLARSMP